MLGAGIQRLVSSSNNKPSKLEAVSVTTPAGRAEMTSATHPVSAGASSTTGTSAASAAVASAAELETRRVVEAAARGDRRAAEQLARSLLPRVRNLVRFFVRGDAEVDDLAQESLVNILRALAGYRGDGNVSSWADRIVVRVVFAHLRRVRASNKLHVEYKADVLEVATHESAARFLARRQAMRALDTLPDEQREVLVMHHVLGLSVREIADELDAAFETVRSRLRLGMARLRGALGELDPAPASSDERDGGAR